jgi:hypothetical protein
MCYVHLRDKVSTWAYPWGTGMSFKFKQRKNWGRDWLRGVYNYQIVLVTVQFNFISGSGWSRGTWSLYERHRLRNKAFSALVTRCYHPVLSFLDSEVTTERLAQSKDRLKREEGNAKILSCLLLPFGYWQAQVRSQSFSTKAVSKYLLYGDQPVPLGRHMSELSRGLLHKPVNNHVNHPRSSSFPVMAQASRGRLSQNHTVKLLCRSGPREMLWNYSTC